MSERDPLDDLPWPSPPTPCARVSGAIHQKCTKNLAGRSCKSAQRRTAVTLLIFAVVVGLFSWRAVAYDIPEGFIRTGLLGALGWSVVLTVTLLFGLASPPGRRPKRLVRVAIAALVPIVFFVYLTNTAAAHVAFGTFAQGASADHAVRCGAICFGVGALMSAGLMLLWRRTDPLTPGTSGALVGLVGGMGSALGMGVACPSHEAWHLCVSHGVVVASLVVLGAAAGRRLLAP
jgi:hypothetical protein